MFAQDFDVMTTGGMGDGATVDMDKYEQKVKKLQKAGKFKKAKKLSDAYKSVHRPPPHTVHCHTHCVHLLSLGAHC